MIGWISGYKAAHTLHDPVEKRLSSFLADNNESLGGNAALAGVIHATPKCIIEGRFQRSVIENDEEVASPESHNGFLQILSCAFCDRSSSALTARDGSTAYSLVIDLNSTIEIDSFLDGSP